jgi:ABC-type Fe3+-hydroxamate transport system substrate-binding protein
VGALAVGRVRAALVALGAMLLLLAATACGERSEPTGPLVGVYPVTVQGGGEGPTIVRSAPHRIVPVGTGPRQILRALGLQRRMITVNDTLVGLPLVGEIRRAKPDLIVASSGTDPLDLARARGTTGAAVYVEPSGSLDDVVDAINDIGLMTGRPVAARKLSARIQAKRQAVARRLAGAKVVKVFVDDGDFATISTRSLLGGVIQEAHARSVAGPSPEQGPFPLKRLLQLDPDVYLATPGSGTTLRQLRGEAVAKRLRAVRTGRFEVLPAGASIAGPQIGVALEQVARMLHPDAVH